MINRRTFLKILAAAGIAPVLPQVGSLSSMYKKAGAAIDYSAINISASSLPDVMPQVINLYLYGGPSELAGNLSNISDIDQNSEVKYTNFFSGITTARGDGVDGSITPSGFWGSNKNPSIDSDDNRLGAGGDDMQFLVDEGHMSVYRTMMNRKNTAETHRESILKNQKGSLDVNFSPGIGTKLASIIANNRALFEDGANTRLAGGKVITNIDELIMPFVSILDGDTRVFDKGDSGPLPLLFNGISLNTDLSNPFKRDIDRLGSSTAPPADPLDPTDPELILQNQETAMLDALVAQTLAADAKDYSEVVEAFQIRDKLAPLMAPFEGKFVDGAFPLPSLPASGVDYDANGMNTTLSYPDTSIGKSLQAAVTLAVENPETLFIALGGALGDWDDHNNGVDDYPGRMRDLFEALRVAMMHLKYTHNSARAISPGTRPTNNIIINVFGDFGRRVNLNTSLGWNHGNNQNFYTLGGRRAGLRTPSGADALGKVVGVTERVGSAGDDRQYTQPTADSYEFEPISVAANIFKYFGVIYPAEVNKANPDPLTAFVDPNDPTNYLDFGSPPIDETQT